MIRRREFLRRPALFGLSLGALALLDGCGGPRGVTSDQMDLVTWYIEDMAHGNQRDPRELVLPDSSDEVAQIATWLNGSTVGDEHQPPRQIASRHTRWPALKALFVQGQVVVLDDGLVGANPTTAKSDQAYALPIVDAENHDRRTCDSLLIGIAKANHSEAKTWLARIAAARIALDTQGGAKRWVGKY